MVVFRYNTHNQGHSSWVTLLWYLSFSIPMLFCNRFFGGIVQVRGQHWKEQGKGGRAQGAQHVNVIPSIDPSAYVTDCSCTTKGTNHNNWREEFTIVTVVGIHLAHLHTVQVLPIQTIEPDKSHCIALALDIPGYTVQ